MNDNEKTYWRSIGMLPEAGSPERFLWEWMATPEGQALYERLKAAAERMDARIPRSYKRTDPTWGEAHKDELPDIVMCFCGQTVRRWSWGEKRDWPQGGPHICPLDEPPARSEAGGKAEPPKQKPQPIVETKPEAKTKDKKDTTTDFLV